jgi:glycosyltransferase involved in cell wall biosynthesis
MSSNRSQLTVLMAVYNGNPFLRTAIDSILNQTYRDFRFLIVDDASTDETREIVRSYDDERIELLCLENNVGQTAALNAGVHQASTPWIARMDADDYSAPTRLEEQMKALEADPSISCLGTFVWLFHENPETALGVITTPLTHEEICRAVSGSPIIHGTIVISREALLDVGSYNDRFRIIADVELYDRLLPRYTAANLPMQLLGVRRHAGQASNSKAAFDESIELSSHRLSANRYSSEDASTVRASLSWAHLGRARFSLTEWKFMGFFKDLAVAIKVSPGSFLKGFFMVFIAYNISERHRSKLKGIFGRILEVWRRRI